MCQREKGRKDPFCRKNRGTVQEATCSKRGRLREDETNRKTMEKNPSSLESGEKNLVQEKP